MLGLVGARGVGKTTLVLQHIKQNLHPSEALYVQADDLYFNTHSLVDFADRFTKLGGKYLFIDEIHKYEGWSQNLKLIYDQNPELKVVFTGSSVLDILKGSADLSRRAVIYRMQGLSFREYLHFFHHIQFEPFVLQDIVNHKIAIPNVQHPLPLFHDYLRRGYYPFGVDENFEFLLKQVVINTLEVDIPMYANMNVATGRKLKQLLTIIADSVPFKPNFSDIAKAICASRNNVSDYLLYIEKAGLVMQLRDAVDGMSGLAKVEKVFLENTNLNYALANETPEIGNVRETFFFNQMRVNHEVIASSVSDFMIGEMTFEVGGKSKKQKQIASVQNGFVVKDDIEFGYLNVIPLWAFGLNY
ncbi:ATPase AAA [Bacteroidia bacterium]|nr:ATPase AAA [Bacteroidia bacterium]